MYPLLVLVTTAALGVEVGWEPLSDGGHEYTILIEPPLLGMLERGTEEIVSEVPPELNVRRYRIKVGTGQLPRNIGPAATGVPRQPDRPLPGDNDFDNLRPDPESDSVGPLEVESNQPDAGAAGEPAIPPPPGSTVPGQPDSGTADQRETWPDEPPRDMSAGPLDSDVPHEPTGPQPPGKLPPDGQASGPIEQAKFNSRPEESQSAAPIETQKPTLPEAPDRPWSVLVGSIVLLCCSLGANAYLGWVAWDARHRFRNAVAKIRTAS